MNKTELIAAVAGKTEITKKDTEAVIAATLDVITEALAKGDKVAIAGFGIFEVKNREARTGRNPRTNEKIEIPSCSVVKFLPGKALKEAVK